MVSYSRPRFKARTPGSRLRDPLRPDIVFLSRIRQNARRGLFRDGASFLQQAATLDAATDCGSRSEAARIGIGATGATAFRPLDLRRGAGIIGNRLA